MVFDEEIMSFMPDIMDNMPGGFFIYRAGGEEELIYSNKAVLRVFGCDTLEEFKELTGYTFKGMVYPEDYEAVEKSIAEQIECSVYDLDFVEYRITQKNGATRWISDYGHFVHSDTIGDVFYVFIEDATDRTKKRMAELKEINDKLTEHQKLLQVSLQQAQVANIAKSTFLANMSHDIRTPLNAILGYVELLQQNNKDPEQADEYLKKIKLSGKQLLEILNEVLDVTSIESGQATLTESEWHMIDMLSEVEKAALPEMNAKNIHFSINKSGIKHFNILADISRVKEVLRQLLDNATKYTNEGGTVTLTVREESAPSGYGKFYFVVEDNGFGISEEFKAHIFEPFAREKNTTKGGILGSGLGLTVVKNFVNMMGGEISVESEAGVGSKFTVSLILRCIDLSDYANISKENKTDNKGLRLLLVEDNEINCEIAKELLKGAGYIVETADDGNVAVEMIKSSESGHYDFILMDIQMPCMDGYCATKEIRAMEDPAKANIPIIALSANAYLLDRKKAIDSGMNAHCSKPIDMIELESVIRSVLSERG